MNIKVTIASVAAAFALAAGFSGAAFADTTPRDAARVAHSTHSAQAKAEVCQSHAAGYRGISTDEVRILRGALC